MKIGNFRLCSSSQKNTPIGLIFLSSFKKNNVLLEFIQLQYQTQKIISQEERPGFYSLHQFHTLQAKRQTPLNRGWNVSSINWN